MRHKLRRKLPEGKLDLLSRTITPHRGDVLYVEFRRNPPNEHRERWVTMVTLRTRTGFVIDEPTAIKGYINDEMAAVALEKVWKAVSCTCDESPTAPLQFLVE